MATKKRRAAPGPEWEPFTIEKNDLGQTLIETSRLDLPQGYLYRARDWTGHVALVFVPSQLYLRGEE